MLPEHRTRIVATIGPASDSPEVLERMIRAGMNVARLNFSHGELEGHATAIGRIRAASEAAGRRVAILADLPGPKIRLGALGDGPARIEPGATLTLTTEEVVGDADRVTVRFPALPAALSPGDVLFLDDGFLKVRVEESGGDTIRCRVIVGGDLRPRMGVNAPGVDLGVGAFTDRDRECLEFALAAGADLVSQSFVSGPADVRAVRDAAAALGREVFVIAKIERAAARDRAAGILDAADGIMVARGDLGVEIPIEEIAVAQKDLIRGANARGKPVITATHMLESMTAASRPTRAEATDVANAILDGTDAVMLSGESAIGRYPVESVAMLAAIARSTEPHRDRLGASPAARVRDEPHRTRDVIAASVARTVRDLGAAAVLVPTLSGATARGVARFRPDAPVAAVSPNEETCRRLELTFGVEPWLLPEHPDDWRPFAREWIEQNRIDGRIVVLVEGPSPANPERSHRMEILAL